MPLIEFDRFVLDTTEAVLLDDGRRVPLQSLEAALLGLLLESRGAIVTKADLLRRGWPGVHVSSETVTRQMSRLRSRLGDTARQPRIISTVARRGYRLLVDVRRARQRHTRPTATHLLPIAVLPLVAESAELQDLASGLTERLIDRLSRLPGARVIGLASVSRFAGSELTPTDVIARLGASSSVTGSLQMAGEQIFLSLELCGADGTRVWACRESVHREKPHLLEGRSVRRFASWFLRSKRATVMSQAPTQNGAAYQLLLSGARIARNLTSTGQLEQARACLSEAIQLDPGLTAAHLALADVHLKRRFFGESTEASRDAKRALDAVLAIDPTCAQAIAMRGVLIEEMEWNRDGALAAVQRAAKLAPHDPVTLFWCAALYDRRGQYRESHAHLDAALAVDPLSMDLLLGRLSSFVKAGRYADVQRLIERMNPLLPAGKATGIIALLGAFADVASGQRKRALAIASREVSSPSSDNTTLLWAVFVFARAGRRRAACRVIDALHERAKAGGYVSPYYFSSCYASIGERELALTWFDRAVAERALHVLYGTTVPVFGSIERSPRFRNALRRIGLLPAASSRPKSVRTMSGQCRSS